MPALAEKQPDQTRIVAFLARESRQPIADVAQIYERERAELASWAHVTRHLHIFAIRKVQEILRGQALDKLGSRVAARPILAV